LTLLKIGNREQSSPSTRERRGAIAVGERVEPKQPLAAGVDQDPLVRERMRDEALALFARGDMMARFRHLIGELDISDVSVIVVTVGLERGPGGE
jgi:hypothetical protein